MGKLPIISQEILNFQNKEKTQRLQIIVLILWVIYSFK